VEGGSQLKKQINQACAGPQTWHTNYKNRRKNMNDLIRIDTDKNGIQTVDARILHEFLESKQQYTDWIKGKIKKYDFVEGTDFVKFHNFMKSNSKPRDEYHLTINMAKELSMVEGNAKGKQARQYFIACEEKSKALEKQMITSTRQKSLTYTKLASELNGAARIAKIFGLNNNQAALAANQAIYKDYGVNCMETMEIRYLDQEEQELHLTPSDIAKRLNLRSAQEANKRLEKAGLQTAHRNAKNKLVWTLTEQGHFYAIIKDTGKKSGKGTPVTQIFWRESVLEELHEAA
jgi:phage anti-repressor protein